MTIRKPGHVRALNTVSGQIALVPESYLKHPVLGKNLVEAGEGQKPYVPELHKPETAPEYKSRKRTKKEPELVDSTEAAEAEASE